MTINEGMAGFDTSNPSEGFPFSRVDAAMRFLFMVHPVLSRYGQHLKVVPVSVDSADPKTQQFGFAVSTDLSRALYVDRAFASEAEFEILAGALYHAIMHQLRDTWSRLSGVSDDDWAKYANIAFDLEINSAIDTESTKFTEAQLRDRAASSSFFSLEEMNNHGVTRCPYLPDDAWLPRVLGLPDGLSAETYFHMLKKADEEKNEEEPPPPSDDGGSGESEGDEPQNDDQDSEKDDAESLNDNEGDDGSSDESDSHDTSESQKKPDESDGDDSHDSSDDTGKSHDDGSSSEPDSNSEDSSDDNDEPQKDTEDTRSEAASGIDDGDNDDEGGEPSKDESATNADEQGKSPNDGSDSDQPNDNKSDTNSEQNDDSSGQQEPSSGGSTEPTTTSDPKEVSEGQDGRPSVEGHEIPQGLGEKIEEMRGKGMAAAMAGELTNPNDDLSVAGWKPPEIPEQLSDKEIEQADRELAEDIQKAIDTGELAVSEGSSSEFMSEWTEEYQDSHHISWEKRFMRVLAAQSSSAKVKGQSDTSYSVPNFNQPKFGVVLPGLYGYTPKPYVVIDVSPSMRNREKMRTATETFNELCGHALKNYGEPIVWIGADTRIMSVGRTSKVSDDVTKKWRFNSGGTSLGGVFVEIGTKGFRWKDKTPNAIEKRYPKPDLLVMITDCCFRWPSYRPKSMAKFVVVDVSEGNESEIFLPDWLNRSTEYIKVYPTSWEGLGR